MERKMARASSGAWLKRSSHNSEIIRQIELHGCALCEKITPWTRVILDRDRQVPSNASVFQNGTTTHITEDVDLEALLHDLYKRGIQSLIVEGGSGVHSEFIRRGLWQKMIVFIAPIVVGGAEAPSIFAGEVARLTDAHKFRFDRAEFVGSDLMVIAYPA